MSFDRFKNPARLPKKLTGGVIAIGNYDGVHRGHQQVLRAALDIARKNRVPAIVLTFEPHPRTYFAPQKPVFRLTDAATKAGLLGHLGFDAIVELTFDADFSSMTADAFIESILLDMLSASHVVTGFDFHFGKARQGNPEFLAQAASRLGFGTTVVDPYGDEGGSIVSSSRIRNCLREGNVAEANGLLGYAFRVSGEVVKGKQLGRELGYPTANLELPPETDIRLGIYAVRMITPDGAIRDGIASFGRRPTFDNGAILLETFLFDYDADLYGKEITILFFGWLRGEKKFDGSEELVAQMHLDAEEAKALLSGFAPGQGLWPSESS